VLRWFSLFWIFVKINLLTTSGPASVGLLYEEAVGKLMTENEFVESVGFSSVLPGSDALQLAMFVGYSAGGLPRRLRRSWVRSCRQRS
jgi:chromate transport protein ChrA